jgi:hypothetical protein
MQVKGEFSDLARNGSQFAACNYGGLWLAQNQFEGLEEFH